MKLHLPKGLRTALLAVLSATAAFSTSAQAAYDLSACVFKDVAYSNEEWATYNEGADDVMKNNEASEGFHQTYMPDCNLQDWTLVIDGYNLMPVVTENPDTGVTEALGVSILCTTGDQTDTETGKVTLNSANALSLFINPFGELRLATTGEKQDTLRNNLLITETGVNWLEDPDTPVSLRIILKWEANEGLPKGSESGKYGKLTVVGVYELSNEDYTIVDQYQLSGVSSAVINNYELPAHLFGQPADNYPLYTLAGDGSQVKTVLRSSGQSREEDAWVPTQGWVVTGQTSINGMLEGAYYEVDENGNRTTNRTWGSKTYKNPDNLAESRTVSDVLYFVGRNGALTLDAPVTVTTEEGDTETVKEYQLTNDSAKISFDIDPLSGTPEAIAGFGATQEDLTLRVDIDVLENTALSGEACGLRIVGDGTTILEVDNTSVKRIASNVSDGDAIALDKNGKSIEQYLGEYLNDHKELDLTVDQLRIEQATKVHNPDANKNYYFAILDSVGDRQISFVGAGEKSNIIIAPKGNGDIILNMISSKLGPDSRITMRDEASERTTKEYIEKVPYEVPELVWSKGIDGGYTFDLYGNPIYQTSNGTVSTGDYNAPDGWKDMSQEELLAALPEVTGVQVVYKQENNSNVAWGDQEEHWYIVTKADGKTPAFKIKLEAQPRMTQQIIAVLKEGNVQVNGKEYVVEGVTKDGEKKTYEIWDVEQSNNEHVVHEKNAHEQYRDANGKEFNTSQKWIVQDSNIIANPIDGTDMRVKLYSSSADYSITSCGYITNEIKDGMIYIDGRKPIWGKDALGAADQVGGILSTLTATGIKSEGGITIDSNLNVTDTIESGGTIDIDSGRTTVENIIVEGGSVLVSSIESITDFGDPHDAQLIVNGKLTLKEKDTTTPEQEENNQTSSMPAGMLVVYGQAKINELVSPREVYVGTDILSHEDAPDATLIVGTADTSEIRTPGVLLRSKSLATDTDPDALQTYNQQLLVKAGQVSEEEYSAFTVSRIESTHICGDTVIELTEGFERDEEGKKVAIKSTLGAGTMEGSDVYLGESALVSPIATNLRHEGGWLELNYDYTTATGTMSANRFIMPEGYMVAAAELEAGYLQATAVEGTPLARTAAAGGAEFTDVHMKNAVVTAGSTVASEITAETIDLGEGHVLSGVNGGEVTIKTTDGLTAGNNTTLNNVKLTGGDLTTMNDVTINNMSIEGEGASFKTQGNATLNNMTLNNLPQFGGTEGDTFKARSGDATLVFDARLTQTDAETKLSINRVIVDASGEAFTLADGESTDLVILEATGNGKVDASKLDETNSTFKAQAYTYAELDTNDEGELVLKAQNKETEIKNELVGGSEVRGEILAALDEARNLTPGGALEYLHDAMGMVMETTFEQRQDILEAISGASIVALADSQRRGVQDMQNNLRNRIVQLGGNPDWENGGFQAWAQADGSFSTTKGSDDAAGYDFNTWGATVGASMDLSKSVVAGLSFSASYGEIESDYADKAKGNNDTYYISFFARHQAGRWNQMLILSAGMNDMDMERTVGGLKAEGTTEGSSYSAYYELGYTLGLNDEFTHIIQPIVSARITSAKVDEYTEEGSIGNAAVSFDGASYTYGSVGIGLRYQGVLYQSVHERNGVLEIRGQVTTDFGDATNTAKLALGEAAMREVEGTDTTGTGFDLGVGISLPIEVQTTFFADADLSVRPDFTGVRANIGLRYDF